VTYEDFIDLVSSFCRHRKVEIMNIATIPDIMQEDEIRKNPEMIIALRKTFNSLLSVVGMIEQLIKEVSADQSELEQLQKEMRNENRRNNNGDPSSRTP